MAEPFLSEIRIFSFAFAPRGWAVCNGQSLAINQNQALFSLLGTTYGGNGITNFNLPNLQGRTAMHFDGSFNLGQSAGSATHTLTINEMPQHGHSALASSNSPGVKPPTNNFWASNTGFGPYGVSADVGLHPTTIGNTGGSQAHENRQPFLTLNFSIALQGIFPSPN